MYKEIKYIDIVDNINYMKIPVTKVNLEQFNYLVKFYNNLYKENNIYREFIWTKSKGISINSDNIGHNLRCYEVKVYCWGAELVICTNEFGCARVQLEIGTPQKEENKMYGRKAYNEFKKILKKYGIDIEKYFINNGMEVKETIEKPLCELYEDWYKDEIFENAYHLDINSAYPYEMTQLIKEWKEPILYLYSKRKINEVFKSVLNMTYGWFQSKLFGAKLAHISKYCIAKTNKRLRDLAQILSKFGCKPISYNVDGLWFSCANSRIIDTIESTLCGSELGKFKLDHKNCKIRFKGPKAYEFIENGKVTIVYSGRTTLDKIKPRDTWEWGDIYKTYQITWDVDLEGEDYGIVKEMEDNDIWQEE